MVESSPSTENSSREGRIIVFSGGQSNQHYYNLSDNVFRTPYKNFHARKEVLLEETGISGKIGNQMPNDHLQEKGPQSHLR